MAHIDYRYLGKKVLRNCHEGLLKCFEPKDIGDLIIQNQALTDGEREKLFSLGKSREERVVEFLGYIKKKEQGYLTLKRMLSGMQWILNVLNSEEQRLIQLGEHNHILTRLTEAQRIQVLTDRQLQMVAELVLIKWFPLGTSLGVPRNKLQLLEHSSTPVDRKAMDMLIKWRQSTHDPVTIGFLYGKMVGVGIDILDDDILELFRDD